MSDTAQLNLKEPEQLDWENAFKSSTYAPPPPVEGADGKPITYYGQIVALEKTDPDQGYLNYKVDLKLTKSGSFDGRQIRTWASTRPFAKRNEAGELVPMKGNPNTLAKLLRGAGLAAKPQTNSEYEASVKAINGKAIPFTLDWEAKNKDTGEVIRGYRSFPDDPERPGQKKTILKAGDVYNQVDSKGNITGTATVQSEILFANARIKYFQDPTPKVVK